MKKLNNNNLKSLFMIESSRFLTRPDVVDILTPPEWDESKILLHFFFFFFWLRSCRVSSYFAYRFSIPTAGMEESVWEDNLWGQRLWLYQNEVTRSAPLLEKRKKRCFEQIWLRAKFIQEKRNLSSNKATVPRDIFAHWF